MSRSVSVAIEPVSFGDAMATMQILKSCLPAAAVCAITECVEQTKDQIVDETVKVLNIDDERMNAEITIENSPSEMLEDYKTAIVSKGKPIEMIELSEDAAGWDWRTPTPVHARIYREGQTHEFRHVFVAKGHLYDRMNHGDSALERFQAWMKYSPKEMYYRYPVKRLRTVRVQDIQAQPELIDPVTEAGADAVIAEYEKGIEGVFLNAR